KAAGPHRRSSLRLKDRFRFDAANPLDFIGPKGHPWGRDRSWAQTLANSGNSFCLREDTMQRRKFLAAVGTGAAAAAAASIAKPAIAQSMPELKWRLTMSWPKSLDTLYGSCETFSKYVSEATDGKFQIQLFAGGEIVPALQALDAVQNGTVEMAHSAQYYYIGKDPTWALFCATPFGLYTRMQN